MDRAGKGAAWTFLSIAGLLLAACAGMQREDIHISLDSIKPGEGQAVLVQGKSLPLAGQGAQVGTTAPDVELVKTDLSSFRLAGTQGRIKIISVVPSLDTPVCEQQTHYLSERNQGLDQQVDLLTVSMDLPFAQKRFARKAGIENVLFLSDHQSAAFGQAYGLLIPDLRLLSRAVLVLDRNNMIRHLQVVPALDVLPDMDAAFDAARRLL